MTNVKRKQRKETKSKKEQKLISNMQTIVNDFWVLWKKMLKISFAQNNNKRTICCTIKHNTHTLQKIFALSIFSTFPNLILHIDCHPFCFLFYSEFYKTIWKIHQQ